ncbi:MAG TPA: hypothetical protein VFE62_04385, partial [Gemmataceae bacterium]|nr:hypothetical protein [Gemmataceae bacterium]
SWLGRSLALPAYVIDHADASKWGWEKYTPATGGFHIVFPKKPIVKDASAATGNFHVIGVKRAGERARIFVPMRIEAHQTPSRVGVTYLLQ